jgi:AcrR family transcriptional regulator
MDTKVAESARERLLTAAGELFYEEGVRSVGIDRVIERAGVAKATLYSTFGSKDELIRAYLQRRHAATRERTLAALATYDSPRDKLLAVFDVLGATFAEPGFHGCAYVNASAETTPGSPIEEASNEARAWRRGLFAELATQAGASDPVGLARQLSLLYDGATIAARMDHDLGSGAVGRGIATTLVDAALGA